MGDPDSSTHIVHDRVEEDEVHVLSLSDEEDPTSRPPESPCVATQRQRPTAFPMAAYSDVQTGLSKHPWNVYPANVARCIDAAFAIQQARHETQQNTMGLLPALPTSRVPSAEERVIIHRMLVNFMPSTMEKCLQEHFVRTWPQDIQRDIMVMVTAVVGLAKLRLQAASLQPMTSDGADELLALLQCLSMSMEPSCTFHMLHRHVATMGATTSALMTCMM